MAEKLPEELDAFRAILAVNSPPVVRFKNSCSKCDYWARVCSLEAPAHPICELGGSSRRLLGALWDAGYGDIESLDEGFYESLTEKANGRKPKHDVIRTCVLTGEPYFAADLPALLDEALTFPTYWMDFETYGPALPLFQGMGTWQKILFQWSVHVMPGPDASDDEIEHLEFLAPNTEDPRRTFAETLVSAIGTEGSVLVYNETFERTMIKELAEAFPDLADELLAINERVVDLLPIVRDNVYHPAFHGSFSIKHVLPALCDGMSYEGLEVSDGTAAMKAYETLIDPTIERSEKARTRQALLEYCGQDTLAMINVYRALRR